jgi:hypothetical protein
MPNSVPARRIITTGAPTFSSADILGCAGVLAGMVPALGMGDSSRLGRACFRLVVGTSAFLVAMNLTLRMVRPPTTSEAGQSLICDEQIESPKRNLACDRVRGSLVGRL